MKLSIALLILAISSQSLAMTGISGRTFRAAEKSTAQKTAEAGFAAQSYRPMFAETDVSRIVKAAETISDPVHFGDEIVFISKPIETNISNKNIFFRLTMASKGKNQGAKLSFDLKNLTPSAKRRIIKHIENQEIYNIGHFEKKFIPRTNSEDILGFDLELTKIDSQNINHLRGIHRLVEGAFKIAKEDAKRGIVVQRTRPTQIQQAGVR